MSRTDYYRRQEIIERVAPKWRLLSYTSGGGDWRWQRAMDLSTGWFPPDPAVDSPIIRSAAEFLRRRGRAKCERDHQRLHSVFPDIVGAEQLSKASTLQLLAVQARVLSGQSDNDIAGRTGIDAAVIAAYEQLFFRFRDVDPKASGWVYNNLIKIDRLPGGATTLRSMALILAYGGGPPVADDIVDVLSRVRTPLKIRRLIRGDEPYFGQDWRIVKALAVNLLPQSQTNAIHMMREYARIKAARRSEISELVLPSTLVAMGWRDEVQLGHLVKPFLETELATLKRSIAA